MYNSCSWWIKRVKKEKLEKVDGKPLIYYPIKDALKTKIIDDIIVSTDDKKIAFFAKKYGAKVPFIRPKKLSGDLATTESCLKHALLTYERENKVKYDYGVFIGATDIFRDINWIIEGVKILNKNKKIESVFSGHVTHKNYWEKKNNKWVRLRKWMSKYSSRQIRRKVIREDTALTCVSRAELWRKGRRIGNNVEIIQNNDPFTALEIHDLQDLKLVNAAYKLRFKK